MKSILFPSGSFWGAGAAVAALWFGGCSSKPKNFQGDCRERFEKLHAKFEKRKFASAKEGYSDFITTCSGTEHVEQAYFELAEAQFGLKDWLEAEQEYASFLKEFPGSKRYEEQARYHMARSMAEQTEIPQRDQTKTLDAMKEYETFLADFPDSPRGDSAKSDLDRLRKLLADRDMQVARLYRRMNEPLAAAIYYKHILKEYGDRVPQREIVLKLADCYIALGQFAEADAQLEPLDGVAKDDPFRNQVKTMRRKLEEARDRHAREKKSEKEEAQKPRPM